MKKLIYVFCLLNFSQTSWAEDLDQYLNKVTQYEYSTLGIDQLSQSDLSSLQNKAGLTKFMGCTALKGAAQPFIVAGTVLGSIGLEIWNPLANLWSTVAGEINWETAKYNMKHTAQEGNPVSIYQAINQDYDSSMKCRDLDTLHQLTMEETNRRAENETLHKNIVADQSGHPQQARSQNSTYVAK